MNLLFLLIGSHCPSKMTLYPFVRTLPFRCLFLSLCPNHHLQVQVTCSDLVSLIGFFLSALLSASFLQTTRHSDTSLCLILAFPAGLRAPPGHWCTLCSIFETSIGPWARQALDKDICRIDKPEGEFFKWWALIVPVCCSPLCAQSLACSLTSRPDLCNCLLT